MTNQGLPKTNIVSVLGGDSDDDIDGCDGNVDISADEKFPFGSFSKNSFDASAS